MNIFDYFTPKSEAFYLNSDATIRQALEKLDYHKFSVIPIVAEDGTFVSTVSAGDILRFIKNNAGFDIQTAENEPVVNIERYKPFEACTTQVPFADLVKLALEQNFVPIVDDRGAFIGIVKRKSILNYLFKHRTETEDER